MHFQYRALVLDCISRRPGRPNFFFFPYFSFTAADGGGFPNGRPKGDARGSAPPEGEGNSADGGCFANMN